MRLNLDGLENLVIKSLTCKEEFFMSRYTFILPAITPAACGVVGFPCRSAPV